MNISANEIKYLISKDKINDSIESLKFISKKYDSDIFKDLLIIESRHQRVRSMFIKGTVTLTELNSEMGKISSGLIELTDNLDKRNFFEEHKKQNETHLDKIHYYLKNVINQNRNIEGLSVDENGVIQQHLFLLKDIYIETKLMPFGRANSQNSLSEMIKSKMNETEIGNKNERKSIKKYLKNEKRIIVLGEPGAGKSVLCNRILNEYGNEKNNFNKESKKIPVIIKCRDLDFEKIPKNYYELFKQSLISSGFVVEETETIIQSLEKLLENGSLFVLVDGLDEIENEIHRNRFSDFIQRLANQFNKNHFLITSRIFGFRKISHRIGAGFKLLKIDSLNRKEIKLLVKNIGFATNLPAKKLDEFLSLIKNESLKPIIKTPLLLSNIFFLFLTRGYLPKRIDDLYHLSIDILFKKISPSSNMIMEYDNSMADLLSSIAFKMTEKAMNQITRSDIESILNQHKNLIRKNNNHFIDNLCHYVGLIVEVGKSKTGGKWQKIYEFRHKSYQEYLTGVAIANKLSADNSGLSFIRDTINLIKGSNIEHSLILDKESIEEIWIEPIKFAILLADNNLEIIDKLYLQAYELKDNADFISVLTILGYSILNLDEIKYYFLFKTFVKKLFSSYEKHKDSMVNESLDIILKNILESKWKSILRKCLMEICLENKCSPTMELKIINTLVSKFDNYRQELLKKNSEYFNINIDIIDDRAKKIDYILNTISTYFDYTNDKIDFEVSFFEKSLIRNLFVLLEYGPLEESLCAWALANLNNASEGPIFRYKSITPLWEPNKKELDLIYSKFQNTKNWMVFRHFFKILIKRENILPLYKKNYSYLWSLKVKGDSDVIEISRPQSIKSPLIPIIKDKLKSKDIDLKVSSLISLAELGVYSENISELIVKHIEEFSWTNIFNTVIPYIVFSNNEKNIPELINILNSPSQKNRIFALLCLIGMNNEQFLKFKLNYKSVSAEQSAYLHVIEDIIKYGANKISERNKTQHYFEEIPNIIISSQKDLIFTVNATDNSVNMKAWFFVLIDPGRIDEFSLLKKGETHNLEDFGEVITSGFGENVPDDVKTELKVKYDYVSSKG